MKPIVHSKSFYYYSVFGKIGNPCTGFLRLYNLGLRKAEFILLLSPILCAWECLKWKNCEGRKLETCHYLGTWNICQLLVMSHDIGIVYNKLINGVLTSSICPLITYCLGVPGVVIVVASLFIFGFLSNDPRCNP
ncbi:hypothetical protein NC653_034327 [Populus alba x Populus x berolinensis]|uniref:Uncharacterized protein n=1 Tax=Populus alba x Populus x berolinensis TaxID=444605 RepID=A0AAD6LM96_9ROSI|nr:hypothetical protein NC653_034327 [Populus alba x Populus x berolinensis]